MDTVSLHGWTLEEIMEQEADYFRTLYDRGMITFEEYNVGICELHDWFEEEELKCGGSK